SMRPRCRPARYVVHAGQHDERQEHRIPASPEISRRGAQGGGRGLVQRFALQLDHLRGGNEKRPARGGAQFWATKIEPCGAIAMRDIHLLAIALRNLLKYPW